MERRGGARANRARADPGTIAPARRRSPASSAPGGDSRDHTRGPGAPGTPGVCQGFWSVARTCGDGPRADRLADESDAHPAGDRGDARRAQVAAEVDVFLPEGPDGPGLRPPRLTLKSASETDSAPGDFRPPG